MSDVRALPWNAEVGGHRGRSDSSAALRQRRTRKQAMPDWLQAALAIACGLLLGALGVGQVLLCQF